MPLINLQTNLKSLKYGNDRQGGGDSGLPYITKDINKANLGDKFDDGLVRGGAVNAAIAGITDTSRIFKFLKDAPKGPLFLVKQIGLQLSNPRLEIPKNPANIASGIPDNLLAVGTNGLLEPTRIYNLGINTLAQIPVNAFGIHFNRHGLLPIQSKASKYEAVVTANNDLGGSSRLNRLVGLTTKFRLGDRTPNLTINNRIAGTINTITQALNLLTGTSIRPINVNPQDLIIDDYAAGPNSVYGIGRTTINRYSNTEDSFKIDLLTSFSKQYAGRTRNLTTGASQPVNLAEDKGTGAQSISTYPALAKIDNNDINTATNLTTFNFNPALKTYLAVQTQVMQQQGLQNPVAQAVGTIGGSGGFQYNQVGIYNTDAGTYSTAFVGKIGYKNSYGDTVVINGSVGSSWNKIAREQRVGSGRQDMINLTPIFEETKYYADNKITIGGKEHNINDLVRFRIQAVDTDSPDKGKWMVFRAYITNLSDDTNSEWTDIKYAGRGEKFYVYNGFSRKINVTLKIAALSVSEMKYIYSKLNFLMSNTMPDYKGVLMRGPLIRMSIGSWLDSQLGKLDSVSLKVPDDSPWEISLDDNLLILPHIVEVSLSFTPIGAESRANNLIPRKSTYTSFIAQNNTGGDVTTLQYVDGVPAVNDETTVSTQQPSVGQANAQTPTSNNVNTNTNNQRAQQTQASRTQQTNANNILIPGRQSQQNPPIFPYNVSQQQVRQPAASTPQYTLFFNTRR